MLKNAFLAPCPIIKGNAPGAAHVRTRLRGETSLSLISRLFFNSLLMAEELRFASIRTNKNRCNCGVEHHNDPKELLEALVLLKNRRILYLTFSV